MTKTVKSFREGPIPFLNYIPTYTNVLQEFAIFLFVACYPTYLMDFRTRY